MNRIDSFDPLIVRVNSEEFKTMEAAYRSIGCEPEIVGDGIVLMTTRNDGVIARFRIDRSN